MSKNRLDRILFFIRKNDNEEWVKRKDWTYTFYGLSASIRWTERYEKLGFQTKLERQFGRQLSGFIVLYDKAIDDPANDKPDQKFEVERWLKITRSNILKAEEAMNKLQKEGGIPVVKLE